MNHNTSHKKQTGPIAWMASNKVAANLAMFVLIIGGFMLSLRIKQEVFPEFILDFVSITIPYPGASPEEVEQGIILAVEEAVRGIDGVDQVRSVAQEGIGSITVEMLVGTDLQKITQDIQNAVDSIITFPEEAEEPRVMQLSHRVKVISLIVYGNQTEQVLREYVEEVRDMLLEDPGITQVELSAIRPYEISIEIPADTLRRYNLTIQNIADKISKSSIEIPGGGIKTQKGEILMRMKERRDYGRQLAQLPIISQNDGTEILLKDIAQIKDNFADIDQFATYNGKPAALIDVYSVGDQTPIKISDIVKKFVSNLNGTVPEGIYISTWNDMSKIYSQRLNLLLRHAFVGLILVFALLGFFLEARLAFWVTMGIPTSFLGAILFLPIFDISINMISLFAFIIALGIVVDDAIVVGENVYEYHQNGMPFLEAAKCGARDIAMPVVFSVLTNIVAFMPLLFIPGIMGKVFKVIPAVVITVFSISLFEALFILPARLGNQKDIKNKGLGGWIHSMQQKFSHLFSNFIKKYYGPFLDLTLKYRYITLSSGIAILILVLSLVISGRLGWELFPRVESDYAIVTATLPYGSPVEKTKAVQEHLIKTIREIIAENGNNNLAEGIFADIGGAISGGELPVDGTGSSSSGNICSVIVSLTPPETRPINTKELINLWRERTGPIPGLESIKFEDDAGGPGSGSSLTVELSHRNLKVLEKASEELAIALSEYPRVKDINDGFSPGKTQLDFKILPSGQSIGLTARDIASQVRNAFYGSEVLRQQRGRSEIKIMVRLPKEERISEYDLEELVLHTPKGKYVPLRNVVDINRGRSYTSIRRRNGRRVVDITANVIPQRETNQIIQSIKDDILPSLIKQYPGIRYSFEGKQADMKRSMGSLKAGFLIAMMIVYAMLAIPFKSYIQPLIIMVSIPFGIVGAILGHLIMGYSLCIISMFGIVALSGVVVNDGLVLIDFANQQIRNGLTYKEAISSAGVRRFRPIMLTTLTTFLGLMPMIFETSRQARFLIPMAISLGYGILFSTTITLLLMPSLFLIIEDIKEFFIFIVHILSFE